MMGMLNKNRGSLVPALVLFALFATVSGVCDDDQVPIELTRLPIAEWNLGTIPHLFLNSPHLRGVFAVSNTKVTGLDTVALSFFFCPATMTIYGNLTASRVRVFGGYTGNIDYLTKGQDTFAHGQGDMDFTVEDLKLTNMVVPLRYSTTTKKLQIADDMQYEASEKLVNPKITGVETDHPLTAEEVVSLDAANSLPTLVEFVRSVINTKVQKGILLAAAKTLFVSAAGQ